MTVNCIIRPLPQIYAQLCKLGRFRQVSFRTAGPPHPSKGHMPSHREAVRLCGSCVSATPNKTLTWKSLSSSNPSSCAMNMQFAAGAFRPVGHFGFDVWQPTQFQQAHDDQTRSLNFGKIDNSVDDFLAQELVVQDSMQESMQGLMMDHDYASRTNIPSEFSNQLCMKDAFQRFDRFLMASGIEQYRLQEQFRPQRFPAMPDLNMIPSTITNTIHDLNYPTAINDFNFAGAMTDYNSSHGPNGRTLDIRSVPTDSETCFTAPSVRPFKNDERSQISRPKLVKQGSVDDFLADERARSRSVSDFLNAIDPPNTTGTTSSSPFFSAVPPAPASSSLSAAAPNPAPSAHCLDKPLNSKKPRVETAPAASRSAASRRPAPAARRAAARREPLDAVAEAEPCAGADGAAAAGEDSAEARERRRREQNREAQRRFRERSKYREFQAFSRRLAAAAGGGGGAACPPCGGFAG